MKVKEEGKDCHLMQPSKEPGLNGTPWPMSPSSRSPSVSRSKAASTLEEAWVQLTQTGMVGRPVSSVTGRLRQEYSKLGLHSKTLSQTSKSPIQMLHTKGDSDLGTRQGTHTYPTWQGWYQCPPNSVPLQRYNLHSVQNRSWKKQCIWGSHCWTAGNPPPWPQLGLRPGPHPMSNR